MLTAIPQVFIFTLEHCLCVHTGLNARHFKNEKLNPFYWMEHQISIYIVNIYLIIFCVYIYVYISKL